MFSNFSRRDFLQLLGSSALIVTLPSTLRASSPQLLHYETFEEIEEALGHSIFYDEYKGNFAAARQIAEKIVEKARLSNDSAKHADALIALAKVQLLQGEATTALATLSQVKPLVEEDVIRQYRFLTFSYAAKVLQQNTFPKGNGYINFIKFSEQAINYYGERKPIKDLVNDPDVLFEIEFIEKRFIGFPQEYASSMVKKNLLVEENTDSKEKFSNTIQYKIEFRDQIASNKRYAHHLPAIELYLAEIYRNLDEKIANENLVHAKKLFLQLTDNAGFAASLLIEGDWFAAPFSTPSIHNTYINSSRGSVHSNPIWSTEEKEFDFSKMDVERAKQLYQKAREQFEQAGAYRGLAAIALRYSYLAAIAGDYSEAKQHSSEAQKIFSEQGDQLGYITATAHHLLARIGNGELINENSSEIAQIAAWGTTNGSYSYALGLGIMIGRVARRWLLKDGDYERALMGYQIAESLYEALDAPYYQTASEVDQGELLLDLGEYTEAAPLFQKAIYFHKMAGEKDYESDNWAPLKINSQFLLLSNLFRIQIGRDDPDALELVVKQIEELFSQFPALLSSSLGFNANDKSYAFGFMVPTLRLRKALERGDEIEMQKWLEVALTTVRGGSSEQRDFSEGTVYAYARYFEEARQAFKRQFDRSAGEGIGSGILKQFNSNPDYKHFVERELQKQRIRLHQLALGSFAKINAYEDAYAHLQNLESLAGKEWWQDEESPWVELDSYGRVYRGLDRLEEAIYYYDQSINLFETRRQRISRDQYKTALGNQVGSRSIYFGAAKTILQLADQKFPKNDSASKQILLAKAYHYIERGKARGLLDLMSSRIGTALPDPRSNTVIRTWHELNAKLTTWRGLLGAEQRQQSPSAERIAYLNQHIAEDEKLLDQAEHALAKANPNFYQTINPQAKVLDAEAIASYLPKNAMLIQYAIGSEELLIWGITSEGRIEAHRMPIDEHQLNRLVESFHRACEQRTPIKDLGNELSALLLEPLASLIEACSRLIIVPFGKLHVLPFHTLPFKEQPLVASHAVSYLPSASVLQFVQLDRPLTANQRVLAIGNPANMAYKPRFAKQSTPQAPLVGAEKEAVFVAKLFPEGLALTGNQPTKEVVRDALDDYPIVHFATHGILSDESPLLSSILLANGEALTVYELMGTQLNADLVVLSACRTAQGEVTQGDDVLGLTRGLLAAGARSAVATLWPVDDIATSLFMEQFYQHVRKGVSPALSLRNAQNDLRTLSKKDIRQRQDNVNRSVRGIGLPGADIATSETNYSHPYYWAAFMLVG